MRDILFRGKRKDNGEWVEGFYVHVPCGRCSKDEHLIQTIKENGKIGELYTVIPETVGQYTGITDKNGKEIYEGDILKFQMYIKDTEQNYKNIFTHIDEVIYRDVAFRLKDNSCAMCVRDDIDTLEVIGNIHDIPELLRRT